MAQRRENKLAQTLRCDPNTDGPDEIAYEQQLEQLEQENNEQERTQRFK